MKKNKKIGIVTPHFWPENFVINDIANYIAQLGNDITVITGQPNYPGGEIYKGYEKIKKLKISRFKNIKVLRFPIIPRKKGSTYNLILNYLSFILNGKFYLKNFLKNNKFDHILVYGVTPITTAILGIFIKKKIKSRLSIWVQDLWPENIKISGHIKNKFLLYLISLIVKYIYKNSDNIIAQSNSFKKNLKFYTKKKIYVVENCSFNNKFIYKKIPNKVQKILNKFSCFTFAGNIGSTQSVETIIECAKKLQYNNKIFFLIIGQGSYLKKMKNLCKKYNLNNVCFFGPYNIHVIYQILKKSSGQILTLKKDSTLSLYIPQKFTMYLAVKKPIIISADGETLKMTKKFKVGYVGSAENVNALYKNIIKVERLNNKKLNKIKKNCSKLFEQKFMLKKQSKKLLEIINN